MPRYYVLELREGYRLRTEPETYNFSAKNDNDMLEEVAKKAGIDLTCESPDEETLRAKGVEQIREDGEVIFPSPKCH